MSGLVNIDAVLKKWSEEYELVAQQLKSKVASTYKEKKTRGGSYVDTFVSAIDDNDVEVGRKVGSATQLKDVGMEGRSVTLTSMTYPTAISELQLAEMAVSPQNDITEAMVAVMNRKRDKKALRAITAKYNKADGTQATKETHIKIDAGAKAFGLDMLLKAKSALDNAECPYEGRYIVGNPTVLDRLLTDEKATSKDYNIKQTLVDGQLKYFLGFTFVPTTLIPVTENKVFFYSGNGMLQVSNYDTTFNIGKSAAHNFDIILHVEEQNGFLRRAGDLAGVISGTAL